MQPTKSLNLILLIFTFTNYSCVEPRYDPEIELIGSWQYEYDQELDIIESSVNQKVIHLLRDADYSVIHDGIISISGTYEYDFTKFKARKPGFFQRKELRFYSESLCSDDNAWSSERGEHQLSIYKSDDVVIASYYNSDDCEDTLRAQYAREYFEYIIDFNTGSLHIPPTFLYSVDSVDSILVQGTIYFPNLVKLFSGDRYVLSSTIETDAPYGLPVSVDMEEDKTACASIDYSFYDGEYCGTWNEYQSHVHINCYDQSDGPIMSFDYELHNDTLYALKGPYTSAESNMLTFDEHVFWFAEHPRDLSSYREQTYYYSKME
ncbi:MAG: hypothetical protein U9N86_12105 [Bacteroidota bacterium]|nr:hypothetical protein [Bacteroidota bacterium]